MLARALLAVAVLLVLVQTALARHPILVAFPDEIYVRADQLPPGGRGPCPDEIRVYNGETYLSRQVFECFGFTIPEGIAEPAVMFEPFLNFSWRPATDTVRVVIDAGHGGHDPGARSVHGVNEKTITLGLAHALNQELHNRAGFEAFMTRTDDRYLTLRERVAIANRLQADIFISIHANAGRRKAARGLEIFIAGRRADDDEGRRLAQIENMGEDVEAIWGDSTQALLTELAMADQLQHSALLASRMLDRVTSTIDVENRGVKRAPFWVLLGSNMPAVLVEAGFVTNREEAARLADPQYQAEVAVALADALAQLRDPFLKRRIRSTHVPPSTDAARTAPAQPQP
jgi:N-acetylmuramoyl-L-alanine amidase